MLGFTADMPQFLYMLLVGTFPFNAFLAGFFSSLSFLVLTGALSSRVQWPLTEPVLPPTEVCCALLQYASDYKWTRQARSLAIYLPSGRMQITY